MSSYQVGGAVPCLQFRPFLPEMITLLLDEGFIGLLDEGFIGQSWPPIIVVVFESDPPWLAEARRLSRRWPSTETTHGGLFDTWEHEGKIPVLTVAPASSVNGTREEKQTPVTVSSTVSTMS